MGPWAMYDSSLRICAVMRLSYVILGSHTPPPPPARSSRSRTFINSSEGSRAENAPFPQFFLLDETQFGHVGFGVRRLHRIHRNVARHSAKNFRCMLPHLIEEDEIPLGVGWGGGGEGGKEYFLLDYAYSGKFNGENRRSASAHPLRSVAEATDEDDNNQNNNHNNINSPLRECILYRKQPMKITTTTTTLSIASRRNA